MPRWSRIILKILGVFIALILVVFIAAAIYVNVNKKSLLATITEKLNQNLNGTLTIGSMDPTFLSGFPGVSLRLNNVVMHDSLWTVHRHPLLEAKDLEVSVNTLALLTGTIEIKKIGINKAQIYLFTDSNGYTNTSIFRKKKKTASPQEEDGDSGLEVGRFALDDVNFVVDNKKGHKLFQFAIDHLKGTADYSWSDWEADIQLKMLVKSLAFNTRRGSFIKDKVLEGPFKITYTDKTGVIDVAPNKLKIGPDPFTIGAKFDTSKEHTDFAINIEVNEIAWKNAANLLAPNISSKLNMFNFEKPIKVNCTIAGNMGPGGDPAINVKAIVKDNVLTTPGGKVDQCNFAGVFTNNFIAGKGHTDQNSAVKLYGFKGQYEQMPFSIDTASIHNLEKPIATGVFKSKFDIASLNKVIGEDVLQFVKGTADVKLAYKADIVDFKLTKPYVTGIVDIKNADVNYVPRKLKFTNTNISLNFTDHDLFIKNIRLQSGKSIVYMDGTIRNFLNSYYTAPEKVLLSWKIRSPQLHLGEFFGFLGSRQTTKKRKSAKTNFSDDLDAVFEKSQVDMHLKVDKVYYNKFLATDAMADLYLTEKGIAIKNVSVKHAGGLLKLNGTISQKGNVNRFDLNTTISNVDIKHFFYSFDNFGLKTLTSKNITGFLFSKTNISGGINNQGKLLPNSLNGSIIFDLKKGALLNFEPIQSVGKFAFPFRDLNNIMFTNLNGKFDVRGQKITINPMQINSSLLNMDIAGVYSMSTGTNIALDVPLRNPKKDEDITDKKEISDRRMKGIVLHLLATDGEDGKIKIKLNRNREKTK
ncbi:AsmA family protein [Pedobacter metabolipauper]|uniref:AsmA-like protein n=1 Tax=Pedobacter metabolipauper TaxID=425513 RepID=A0A4R6SZF5_9SPHI|nr:AsmA family protein [Pedobacter metabolipauper]TDQ11457.1 AsmA-like protein [Pedobacter metabolipauper]